MLAALVRRGFQVSVPFGEGHSYDLVVDVGSAVFLRVQCKTAWPQKGCLVFNPHMTDHGRGRRSYVGLRLEPTRNNQRRGVRYAADYGIERWSADSLREIAQMGRAPMKPR